MNAAHPPLPGLLHLRRRDHVIERGFKTAAFMAIVIAGFRWAAPAGAPPPGVDLSFEIGMAKWVPIGALVIGVLAVLITARRYAWVREVLSNGITIRGMVENVDIHEREARHSENAPAFRRAKIRSYRVTIRYSWMGEDHKVRLRTPGSPSGYKVYKDKETELVILESQSRRPLIRSVYLGS